MKKSLLIAPVRMHHLQLNFPLFLVDENSLMRLPSFILYQLLSAPRHRMFLQIQVPFNHLLILNPIRIIALNAATPTALASITPIQHSVVLHPYRVN